MSDIDNPVILDEIETEISTDLDFSASSSESATIAIGAAAKEVLRGRLYIDADPGAAFSQWATLTIYNKSGKLGEDIIFRTDCKLVYTELEVATTGSDTNYFIGNLVHFDADAGSAGDEIVPVYPDGDSNSKMTVTTAGAFEIEVIAKDSTNWYIFGTVTSATAPAFADQ